jgi:hypothetical protein
MENAFSDPTPDKKEKGENGNNHPHAACQPVTAKQA